MAESGCQIGTRVAWQNTKKTRQNSPVRLVQHYHGVQQQDGGSLYSILTSGFFHVLFFFPFAAAGGFSCGSFKASFATAAVFGDNLVSSSSPSLQLISSFSYFASSFDGSTTDGGGELFEAAFESSRGEPTFMMFSFFFGCLL